MNIKIFILFVLAFAKAYCQEVKTPSPELLEKFKKLKEKEAEMIGKPLNYFEMYDMKGNSITSKDLEGKITVVNFWYKECKPCIEEMPELNGLVSKYKREDVKFVAFSTTEKERLNGFFEKHPFNYEIIPNSKRFAKANNVQFFPTNMILDRQGNIKYLRSGYSEGVGELLAQELEKLISN